MGTMEAPWFLVGAFHKPISCWQHETFGKSRKLYARCAFCDRLVNCSIATFADDIFKKHLVQHCAVDALASIKENEKILGLEEGEVQAELREAHGHP